MDKFSLLFLLIFCFPVSVCEEIHQNKVSNRFCSSRALQHDNQKYYGGVCFKLHIYIATVITFPKNIMPKI